MVKIEVILIIEKITAVNPIFSSYARFTCRIYAFPPADATYNRMEIKMLHKLRLPKKIFLLLKHIDILFKRIRNLRKSIFYSLEQNFY